MLNRNLWIAFTLVLFIGCGGPQPTPPAPAPEPPAAPAVETPATPPAPEPPPAPAEPEKPALKTPANLQAAYAGETNAIARYKAFAETADKEKYKTVAVLFRAAARAEEIHSKNIGDTITAQGGTPVAGTETPVVKTTAENVKAALAGESAERDTTYPGFAATAEEEGNTAAVRLFKGIAEVEAQHARLYQKVDKDLPNWKKAKTEFWLCTVCGNVMTASKNACSVCATDPSTFEEIK